MVGETEFEPGAPEPEPEAGATPSTPMAPRAAGSGLAWWDWWTEFSERAVTAATQAAATAVGRATDQARTVAQATQALKAMPLGTVAGAVLRTTAGPQTTSLGNVTWTVKKPCNCLALLILHYFHWERLYRDLSKEGSNETRVHFANQANLYSTRLDLTLRIIALSIEQGRLFGDGKPTAEVDVALRDTVALARSRHVDVDCKSGGPAKQWTDFEMSLADFASLAQRMELNGRHAKMLIPAARKSPYGDLEIRLDKAARYAYRNYMHRRDETSLRVARTLERSKILLRHANELELQAPGNAVSGDIYGRWHVHGPTAEGGEVLREVADLPDPVLSRGEMDEYAKFSTSVASGVRDHVDKMVREEIASQREWAAIHPAKVFQPSDPKWAVLPYTAIWMLGTGTTSLLGAVADPIGTIASIADQIRSRYELIQRTVKPDAWTAATATEILVLADLLGITKILEATRMKTFDGRPLKNWVEALAHGAEGLFQLLAILTPAALAKLKALSSVKPCPGETVTQPRAGTGARGTPTEAAPPPPTGGAVGTAAYPTRASKSGLAKPSTSGPAQHTKPSPKPGEPGSPEHKAERWKKYLERGGKLSYEQWSGRYELNMLRAQKANAAVDAYHETLGWGEREVTVKVQGTVERRLDIADVAAKRGIEYKTGHVDLDAEIVSEMARDAALIRKGWTVEWVIKGTASKGVTSLLNELGIPHSFR